MRHPSTRAERRFARAVARERYRSRLRTCTWSERQDPQSSPSWNRGAKECEAHGNRCGHSMIDRWEARQEVKAVRRLAFDT
ncbi:hypothetical protein GCM10022270_23590 [Terriglobus aquaticus]